MNEILSPPPPQLKREHSFCVRLTAVERRAIQQLAHQMKVTPSHLVRYFLMQAVEYYLKEKA